MSAVYANRQRPALRLPPYGRELLDLRRRGLVPVRHAWFGHILIVIDDWKMAAALPDNRMIVPKELDPAGVNFTMCAGLDIVIVWSCRLTTLARRDKTIQAVMRCKPVSLRIVDMDAPRESFWILSHKYGLERPELFR
jgi:hypothetical protein